MKILIGEMCVSIFCKSETGDDFQGGWILLQATILLYCLSTTAILKDVMFWFIGLTWRLERLCVLIMT